MGPSAWCRPEPGWRACSWIHLVFGFGMKFKVRSHVLGKPQSHAIYLPLLNTLTVLQTPFPGGGRYYFKEDPTDQPDMYPSPSLSHPL